MKSREGYTLIIAIMLVFIVMLLIASWISYIQMRSRRIICLEDKSQAFYNAESGLAKTLWYLSRKEDINFTVDVSGIKTMTDTLFENGNSTAKITVKTHGFFTEIISEGKEGKQTETVKALIGCSNRNIFSNSCNILSPALLYIKGSVKGNIETRGSVEGNINGEVIQNPSLLFPAIDYHLLSDRLTQYRTLLENPSEADTEIFGPLVIDEETDLPKKNVIYVNDVVLIENDDYSNPLTIEGNSTIISSDEIQVSGNIKLCGISLISYGRILLAGDCMVKDAILYSESKIEIRENAKFDGIIVTKGEIKICEDVNILKNSLLLSNTDKFEIKLDDRVNIDGIIILCPKVGLGKTVTSQIVVDKDVKITGLIYSTTGVRLKGTLLGTVYTPTFIGEPIYPDTHNMNVLEGKVTVMKEPNVILPLIFMGLPQKTFSWEKK